MESNKELWLPPLSIKDQQRKQKKDRTGFKDKNLWDWLQLLAALAVPVFIAGGTLWFSAVQSQATLTASEQQHKTDLQIAQQQYENNVNISNDQQQENTLQTYLDRMSDLLLNENLRMSKPGSEVRNVARARTLTILPQLNGNRKGEVLQFLYEAGLINTSDVIIDLSGAYLEDTFLDGTDLKNVNLSNVDLNHAVLDGDNLNHANLRGSYLGYTVLLRANLSGANLSNAWLFDANLVYTSLNDAVLVDVNLAEADLSHTNLSGANLSNAFLCDAKGWTTEQLNKASLLRGTIMPDGSQCPSKQNGSGG